MKNRLNRLFWFTDPKRLDVQEDQHLIIHHTFAYGTLRDIAYLLRLYSLPVLKKNFLKPKRGYYDPRALAFAKELLGVRKMNSKFYIKRVAKTLS